MPNVNFRDRVQEKQAALFESGLYGRAALLGLRVDKAAATLPQTGNQTLFTITGGRVLVTLLYGEVTTVIQNQANNTKVTSVPSTGTALDLAANLDIANDEAGTLYIVEGDGTALVGTVAGGAISAVGLNPMIIPAGIIRLTTAASNTGATKWQLWYFPLDNGATVVSG